MLTQKRRIVVIGIKGGIPKKGMKAQRRMRILQKSSQFLI